MSIFSRFGKSKELYVLKRIDEEGEEIIGKYPAFINKKEVSVDIESGILDEGVYKFYQIVDGTETRKWSLKPRQPKKTTITDTTKMDKDEAFKAIQNKADDLREQTDDFRKFRDGVLKQFGEGNGSASGEIIPPIDLKGIGDGLNRGFGRAAYTGAAKRDTELIDNLFGLIGGISDLATGAGFALAAKAGPDALKKLDAKKKRRERTAEENEKKRLGEEAKVEAEREERKAEVKIKETEKEKVMTLGTVKKEEEKVEEKLKDFEATEEDFDSDVLEEKELENSEI